MYPCFLQVFSMLFKGFLNMVFSVFYMRCLVLFSFGKGIRRENAREGGGSCNVQVKIVILIDYCVISVLFVLTFILLSASFSVTWDHLGDLQLQKKKKESSIRNLK